MKISYKQLALRITLASVTLIAVFAGLLILDYGSSKGRWLAWRADRMKRGDRFDRQTLYPPEVPDAENFAQAPLVAAALQGKNPDPRLKALSPPPGEPEWGDWRAGRRAQLKSIAGIYKTDDLQVALTPLAPTLLELEKASRRPHCRLERGPEGSSESLNPLLGLRGVVRTLRLRALLSLSKGHSPTAMEDVLTCLRMSKHLEADPDLTVMLLHAAILNLAVQPIWEGLMDHRWNEKQLAHLQEALQQEDLLASARLAFEEMRLQNIHTLEAAIEGPPEGTQPNGLRRGWIYRNMLEMDQAHAYGFLDRIQPAAHRVFVQSPELTRARRGLGFRKDLILAQLEVPALMGEVTRVAHLQSMVDQAAIACALERFRISKGAYPTSLAQLSPAFLEKVPKDLISGEPLHYQLRPGGFRLYSAGWNGKDEGGSAAWREQQKRHIDPSQGDWAWASHPKG